MTGGPKDRRKIYCKCVKENFISPTFTLYRYVIDLPAGTPTSNKLILQKKSINVTRIPSIYLYQISSKSIQWLRRESVTDKKMYFACVMLVGNIY